MATWNAVYIRDPFTLEAKALQAIRQGFAGPVVVRRWRDWTELALPGLQDGEALARRLSLEAGVEVRWVQIQTVASVLCIVHHDAGKLVRRLVHGDGEWRTVEGTVQPWEATALFSERALEDALEGCGGDEEEEVRVRQVFRERALSPGSHIPTPGEFESFWAALGMDLAQWQQLRASAPVARVDGTKGRGRVWLARTLLLGAAVSVALLVGTRQPLFYLMAGLMLTGGGWLAFTRWLNAGRWLS